MNRSKNKTQTKVKRTVLSLLNRRSTRVEPEAIKTEQNSNENRQSISAQTSPIKSLTDDELRRHRCSQNINSTDTATTPKSKQKIHICNNRLSHQFGLCCAIDERASTPPVTVRYKSLPDIELNKTTTPNHHPNGISNQSVLEEHQAVIHEPPPSHLPSPEHHQNHLQHSSSHQEITSSSSSSTKETSKRPIFNEIQNSIAVSACRSRLRDKILGKTITIVDQQHSSYPNIAINNTKFHDIVEHSDGNRSFSYDGLIPGSADSLAKQSLIAAQLLNLIPTEKARERNYLSGRLAVTSLFGLSELERVLPAKEVRIFVGTWNMNEQNPPKQMNDFVLPSSVEHIPDVVVIGTQESCSVRFDWEVTLQETLGPSHILLHSASLGTLHLAVFIRRDLIWFCSEPEDDSLSVRPGTAFRTKGAVAISFCLFGTTMLFVTSHLTAHQQKVKERVQDVKRIIHSLDLPRNLNIRTKNRDVTQNFDCVYWCGDLNFRLGEPREKVLKWIENTKFPLPAHMPHGYMHTDQLKSVLANGAAFKDFKEAHITFPPTYKYDPGTQNFDTSSKQRTPAYTDRILYKFKSMPSGIRRGSNLAALLHSAQVECLAYDSVPSIVTSDHKPVWALFRNPIRPGIDSVPLAAGLFNREVYLEGMKRRLSNSRYQGSSAVCVIQ